MRQFVAFPALSSWITLTNRPYLLGEKYITAICDLAASPGGKTVLLPGDLLQSLQALVGRGRSG